MIHSPATSAVLYIIVVVGNLRTLSCVFSTRSSSLVDSPQRLPVRSASRGGQSCRPILGQQPLGGAPPLPETLKLLIRLGRMINESNLVGGMSSQSPANLRGWKIAGGLMALALPFALATVNLISPGVIPGGGGKSAFSSGPSGGAVSRLSGAVASQLSGAGADLLAMIGLRSPGERKQGELADTKGHRTAHVSTAVPHQRALAKVRPPPKLTNQPVPVNPDSVQTLANALTPPPTGAPVAALLPGNILPGVGPSIGPIFGGGGGGGGGGISIVPPVIPPLAPPVTSAVPEPSTWAQMLIAFLGIGIAFRRARRRQAPRGVEAIVSAK